jgi:hypothetical protein
MTYRLLSAPDRIRKALIINNLGKKSVNIQSEKLQKGFFSFVTHSPCPCKCKNNFQKTIILFSVCFIFKG